MSTARAEDRGQAEAAYKAATQHYNLAEYPQALERFKEAYRYFENPVFLFNIAQCYRQIGDKAMAIRFYRNYLNTQPTAENRQQVRELITRLEKQITEEGASKSGPPLGTLPPGPSSGEASLPAPEAGQAVAGQSVAVPVSVAVAEPAPQAIVPHQETATTDRPATARPTPIHRRWWLWTIVGVGLAAGIGVGVGVGVVSRSPAPRPEAATDFGTFKF